MNILLSNDDGINAKGIHVLAEALSQLDDVRLYICAPDRQRSCCGHALTMVDELSLTKHDSNEFGPKAVWAYECDGLPADCVRLALYALSKEDVVIDLVCTGINMGANYGTDVYYSGTMAAAREGAVCFTQAIAFSLASHQAVHYDLFYKLVPEIVQKAYGKIDYKLILSVNVPDIPPEEVKGLKICRQGPMIYSPDYVDMENGNFVLDPNNLVSRGDEMIFDGYAGNAGYVTITPCELFPYNQEALDKAEKLDIVL